MTRTKQPAMTAEAFREKRKAIGWTQTQAGEALGLTAKQIAGIENGRSNATKTVAMLLHLYKPHDIPGRPTGTKGT